ncbi:MAG: M28 family peptidase [Bacteroidota bacterium]
MKRIRLRMILLASAQIFALLPLQSQTNLFLSNPEALTVLKGDFNPAIYNRPGLIRDPESIRMGIIQGIDGQEQIRLLTKIESFYNRNSGSDTLSLTTGIGACRSWILAHFDQINKAADNRLITGYLEFDGDICTNGHHKNPFLLIPGSDTTSREIVFVEGHYDTRNEDRCDIQGFTPGIEDNGSGTVLVMELARVLSRFSFSHSILLTTTTGEDEGLWGAKAWAEFLSLQGIKIRAVLNNDIVGGIYCGKTSPAPSCPYYGHADSTHVRVFSFSAYNNMFANSPHKQLVRYMKYVQETLINPYLSVPLTINIMMGEDRSGRGGDHTPFRQKGYTAVRISSANEHGNGTGTPPDRNHSTRDVLRQDINNDGIPDSLFINPGYLARNTILNGVVAGLLATAPDRVNATVQPELSGATINLPVAEEKIDEIIIGIRRYKSKSLEFDTVFTVPREDHIRIALDAGQRNYVSVAPVRNGAPGLFSDEYEIDLSGSDEILPDTGLNLIRNFPNPWSSETTIQFKTSPENWNQPAVLEIKDMIGRLVDMKSLTLSEGINEVVIYAGNLDPGLYSCTVRFKDRDRQSTLIVKN